MNETDPDGHEFRLVGYDMSGMHLELLDVGVVDPDVGNCKGITQRQPESHSVLVTEVNLS